MTVVLGRGSRCTLLSLADERRVGHAGFVDGAAESTQTIERSAARGLVVAIVGSDGSGKSTLCRELTSSLRAGGRVEFVYFGSGDGASSWIRWPLVQVRRLVQRRSTDTSPTVRPPGQGSTAQSAPRSKPIVAARVVWALTLAWEKRAKLRRAARSRARGVVVICDRFPQAQVGGIMDGPLLHTWQERPRGLRKRVAAWEARPYRLAERQPPDLVLRLLVDQAHAERRRPDHDSADLRRRREIVGSLRFDGVPCLVDLDATLPADAVLASAMAAVAHCLDQRASGSTPKEK